MNNLEKLIEQYENGDSAPLLGIFYHFNGGDCDYENCPARDKCVDIEGGCAESRARWLLMEYVEPDSLERIAADAKKSYIDYWGCQGFCCQDCPAVIDGETPSERFSGYGCDRAMAFDVVRRLNALDAS